jgi:hypothetical protein
VSHALDSQNTKPNPNTKKPKSVPQPSRKIRVPKPRILPPEAPHFDSQKPPPGRETAKSNTPVLAILPQNVPVQISKRTPHTHESIHEAPHKLPMSANTGVKERVMTHSFLHRLYFAVATTVVPGAILARAASSRSWPLIRSWRPLLLPGVQASERKYSSPYRWKTSLPTV